MKIKQLSLYSHQIEAEKRFYAATLGFPIVAESAEQVSFAVGWSILTFKKSQTPHLYHYCFLIPANKLQEALAWAEKRLHIIVLEDDGTKTVHFENWNADSFYFYDARCSNTSSCAYFAAFQRKKCAYFCAGLRLCEKTALQKECK